MNLEEAIKALKEGKKVRKKVWKPNDYIQIDMSEKKFIQGIFCGYSHLISLSVNEILDDDWEIVEEPVLDKQEKKYLENFLRPYTKKYEKITIKKASLYGGDFTIRIDFFAFKDGGLNDILSLPLFNKDEHMYEGMEVDKSYTLEELGLFEDEWEKTSDEPCELFR